MGRNGRQRVESKFTIGRSVAAFERIYDELARRRRDNALNPDTTPSKGAEPDRATSIDRKKDASCRPLSLRCFLPLETDKTFSSERSMPTAAQRRPRSLGSSLSSTMAVRTLHCRHPSLVQAAFASGVAGAAGCGKNRALNTGVDAVEGKFVVVTDDDAMPTASFLTAWEQFLGKHEEYGLFGGRIEPLFEVPPPKWLLKRRALFAMMFAERDLPEGPVASDEIYGPTWRCGQRCSTAVFDSPKSSALMGTIHPIRWEAKVDSAVVSLDPAS